MGKTEREFIAHIGEPIERLVGSGATQTVVRSREVLVKINGAVIETIQAADDETDIHEKLIARGFIPGVRTDNTIVVSRKSLDLRQKSFLVGIAVFILIIGTLITVGVIDNNKLQDEIENSSAKAEAACTKQMDEVLKNNGVTWNRVVETGPFASKLATTGNTSYKTGWQITGTLPAGLLSWSELPVAYTCNALTDSDGDVRDVTVKLHS